MQEQQGDHDQQRKPARRQGHLLVLWLRDGLPPVVSLEETPYSTPGIHSNRVRLSRRHHHWRSSQISSISPAANDFHNHFADAVTVLINAAAGTTTRRMGAP